MARTKPLIFISHVHEDAQLAACLKGYLAEVFLGFFDVFVSSDGSSIRAGDNWAANIESALKRADLLLVLLTKTAANRRWIYFEAGGAYFAGVRVIPICCRHMSASEVEVPLSWLQVLEGWRPQHAQQLIGDIATFFDFTSPPIDPRRLAGYLNGEGCDTPIISPKTTTSPVVPVFVLADTSGSMTGEPIRNLTNALTQFVDLLRDASLHQHPVLFSLIAFDSSARLVIPPQPVENIGTVPELLTGGATHLGNALDLLKATLSNTSLVPPKSAAPVVVLITDGLPLDNWQPSLEALKSTPLGNVAERLLITFGDLDEKFVSAFVGKNVVPLASNPTAAELRKPFERMATSIVGTSAAGGAR